MTDIVERLRERAENGDGWTRPVAREAADEIERLREVIAKGLRMREAQAAYFKQRSQQTLVAAKAMETDFDRAARAALGDDRA
ncbi:MAG: hypothetical protein RLZZ187_2607 [Pseudomonadota bacterium]|jgi:hypothetical protein